MRHWRWAVVISGLAALVSGPIVVANRPVDDPSLTAPQLAERVLGSATQPFEGLYRTRGGLRLPDLGRLDDEVAAFAGSSRVRVWYGGPDRWRADELLVGAERGVYRQPDGLWLWDSGTRRIVFSPRTATESVRIPRLMDLSPAELGRRIVAEHGAMTLTTMPAKRVAGEVAAGLRVTAASGGSSPSTSTVTSVDLWVDPETGVVLEVQVHTGATAPAFEASFIDVSFGRPADDVMQFDPDGVDEPVRQSATVDPIEQADQFAFVTLPDSVGGLARRNDITSGLGTYGAGLSLVNLAVVPAESLGRRIAALPQSKRPWGGSAALLQTSLVNLQIVRIGGFAVVLSGTVTMAELDRIAGEIVRSGQFGPFEAAG